MSFTKNIPVTSAIREDITSIKFEGSKIIITFADGDTAEYKYEFIGRYR